MIILPRFGFDPTKYPAYLTMALGAGSVTPMEMLTAYSVFANGGYFVNPYFIQRIEDAHGNILYQAKPDVPGNGAKQVIDVRNAYTMVSMLQDVVRHGTGIRAMQLGRQDLAGKTGTTNDSIDAWFCGFQPTVVGIAWMGYDQPRSLGDRETGGGAALPIWMSYMGKVLQGVPEATYTMPDNMVEVHIDADGYRDDSSPRVEYFYKENAPPARAVPAPSREAKPADIPVGQTTAQAPQPMQSSESARNSVVTLRFWPRPAKVMAAVPIFSRQARTHRPQRTHSSCSAPSPKRVPSTP